MERRDFLRMAAAAAALVAAPRTSRAATARVDVLVNEPIGPITPDIYGHFVEHLGGVVYDGIWVGEGSKVPNTNGIRQALVDAMRKLPKGAIRWPGGCFADSYDWRDGIGPRDARPRRTNFWAGGMRKAPDGPSKYDTNHFGTVDFARFCRLVGSEPYFAANLRSLPARDFYQWVEYCNSPAGTTTLADLRAKDGEKDPLKVRYWGVGNESWGCGGDFTAEEYAVEFRRFTSWVPGFDTPPVVHRLRTEQRRPRTGRAASSASSIEKGPGMLGRVYGLALHHYTENLSFGDPAKNGWDARKGSARRVLERRVVRDPQGGRPHGRPDHEPLDRDGRVRSGSAASSWSSTSGAPGTRPGPRLNPSHLLGQQNTMRDAVVAGLTLRHLPSARRQGRDGQHRAARELPAVALPRDGDKFVTTPTYHVFDLYGAHVGGQAVRTHGVGAGHHLPAPDGHGLGPRPQRVGQREGQDADAHGDQPARQRGAGGRDRGPRRGAGRGEGRADQRAGHPRPQHVRATRTRSGSRTRRSPRCRTACSCTASRRRR